MAYAVFDIETRIDKELLKAVYAPRESIDEDTAYERVRAQLLAESGSDFIPYPFHIPIVIIVGSVTGEGELTNVEEVGGSGCSEQALVRAFWDRVEHFRGTLVSFNGRAFDLPVLELHALRYACPAPRYFNEKYGHRYRYSEQGHYDLYDFLTNSGAARLRGGLNLLARVMGLPGKGDIEGSQVQAMWEAGRTQEIIQYCRRDVIQTYFLFLRIELMRGRVSPEQYAQALKKTETFRQELAAS